jgi:cellulose 1,4-beta-cellobiosidase
MDLAPIARDAVSRGYLSNSCYLIDVEAGFELWQGGAGLATNSFSVAVNGQSTGGGSPTPSKSASSSPTATSTPTSGGGGTGSGCTATYAITGSWPGGFQGQVTVAAGSSALSGWKVGWSFPAAETINNLWNGSYTQSGQSVSVTNANYDGSVAAGASTTFGFTATDSGSDAAPSALTCTSGG